MQSQIYMYLSCTMPHFIRHEFYAKYKGHMTLMQMSIDCTISSIGTEKTVIFLEIVVFLNMQEMKKYNVTKDIDASFITLINTNC